MKRELLLSDFLRTRRAKLTPAAVGLPDAAGRRVPGLRREEVAQLAGISTSWYTLLEQGQRTDISAASLLQIARALKLNSHETAYLFLVGSLSVPFELVEGLGLEEGATLPGIVECAQTDAVISYDAGNRVTACTPIAAAAAGFRAPEEFIGQPLYERLFTEPFLQRRYGPWSRQADHAASVLRFNARLHPIENLNELLEIREFRARWGNHDVHADIGWRPPNVVTFDGFGIVSVVSFGLMLPGGGRALFYLGATERDRTALREISASLRSRRPESDREISLHHLFVGA